MFAFLKKLFGKSDKTEVKVNSVIARAEAANLEVPAKKKPRVKKAVVQAKTARNKKPKAAG